MDQKTAAVITTYNTAENEMKFICGKELEVAAIKMETPAGLLDIKKKEVEGILSSVLHNELLFQERSRERIMKLLSNNGVLIQYVNEPDKDMQLVAISDTPVAMKYIKNPDKEVVIEHLKNNRYEAVTLGYMRQDDELFKRLTSKEIGEIVRISPAAMSAVPRELINSNILHLFLEGLVKNNQGYLEGAFSNIPEELKDKFYWQCMCMVNGYNYTRIPKEHMDEYVSFKLIEYTLEHASSYVGTLWMYQYIPEKFKTEQVSIDCILKHFGCISYIPKDLKNDNFYKKLASAGGGRMSWFQYVDISTMSKQVFKELVYTYHITGVPDNTPASYITEEIADILAEVHSNKIPNNVCTKEYYDSVAKKGLYNRIPETELTKDRCMDLLNSNKYKVLDRIPERVKTDEFMKEVIQKKLYSNLQEIADYLTEDIVQEAIISHKVSSFEDLPVKYRVPKIIQLLVECTDRWIHIPEEFQTPEICSLVLSHCDKQRYEWLYSLMRMKYKFEEDLEYAVNNFKDAIKIPELSREQIECSLLHFPENILQVPKWYFDQQKTEEKHSNTKKTNNVTIVPDSNTEFIQMDIFGLLGIPV